MILKKLYRIKFIEMKIGGKKMSYIDQLDRKKSINCARREMNHFSDLYKLHEFNDTYRIKGTCSDSVISIINCLNYDAEEINKIDRKDRQLVYIQKVLKAVSKLTDRNELEYIYYKYVLILTNDKIEERLNISPRTRGRLASKALFNMALLLNIEVFKGEE